ncbi:substrate-binding domain-containing protein, partial [Weissella soli]
FETTLSKHGGLAVAEKVNQAAVSAVFAVNDELAIGVLRGLADLGVRVPQDISVVGYDNTDYAEFVIPSLTTVTQPVWQLGQKALDLVLHRLEDPQADLVTEMMAVKLVERESTK